MIALPGAPPAPVLPALSLLALALSLGCLYVIPDGPGGVLPFLAAMGGASLAFLALAWVLIRRALRPKAWQILLLTAAFHGLLLPTGPHLDDDLYRYTWDGKVLLAGHNPFLYPPSSLDLIELWRKDQYRIPYDHVPTIYPPATQAVFLVVTAVKADSFLGMKLAFSLINVAVVGVLLGLLAHLGLPSGRALIYGLNPLVLKEVANSGHMDPWLLLWLLLSVRFLLKRRAGAAALSLALAILSKWVPLLLLPLFARRLRGGRWLALLFGALALAYLPFAGAGAGLFTGLGTYGDYWIFNPGLFSAIDAALRALPWSPDIDPALIPRLGRLIAAGLAGVGALWLAAQIPREGGDARVTQAAGLTLGLLLLLSPTVDPWYLLWIAPFVALHPSAPGLAFCLLPLLSYAYYLGDADPWRLRILEYGVLALLMGAWVRARGIPLSSPAPSPPSEATP